MKNASDNEKEEAELIDGEREGRWGREKDSLVIRSNDCTNMFFFFIVTHLKIHLKCYRWNFCGLFKP